MRKIKRAWQRLRGEFLIRPRRAEIAGELQAHFRLSSPPQFVPSGSRGHDSGYTVRDEERILGMLRLVNPHKSRPDPAAGMPFILEDGPSRITREWQAYTRGASYNLTPKPLWRTYDALLCEYLPLRTMHAMLLEKPERAWELVTAAMKALHRLHQTGITHMDVSLANALADENLEKIYFIDFEYGPASGISPAQQRVYDHLRLLESTWKFTPDKNAAPWIEALKHCLDGDMRRADLKPLTRALSRILSEPTLVTELRAFWPSL